MTMLIGGNFGRGSLHFNRVNMKRSFTSKLRVGVESTQHVLFFLNFHHEMKTRCVISGVKTP